MSRPKNSETMRPDTRLLWAQKISSRRAAFRLCFGDIQTFFDFVAGKSPAATTMRRYERIGPPTLKKATAFYLALEGAVRFRDGGLQLDLIDALKRARK